MNLEECKEFIKETDCKHLLLRILAPLFRGTTSLTITKDCLYSQTGYFSFDSITRTHHLNKIPFCSKLSFIWDSFLENPELLGLTLEKLLAPIDIKVLTCKEKSPFEQEYVIKMTFDREIRRVDIKKTMLYKAFKSYFTEK